jgi:ribose-phosphate pyrophosphokinase
MRLFPDRESYVRIVSDVAGKDVDIVCTLADPDPQFLRLIFAAQTARELGAKSVNLIAPYLAYMRQDARFKDGEAITSSQFARLISGAFDRLVTVDPHLHRRQALGEIYTIPARTAHAAPLLGAWIKARVENPVIIGPDRESEQWVTSVAKVAEAPHVVMSKQRWGDREVKITLPQAAAVHGRTPVLVDDVASSGHTMIEAARVLNAAGMGKPYCLVVHAVFAEDSYARLSRVSQAVVSTDTIPHVSNAINVASLLV